MVVEPRLPLTGVNAMAQTSTSIDTRYDALMFAKSPEAAQKAGEELVRTVLGERASHL